MVEALGGAGLGESRSIGSSVYSAQFCCEPKTALKSSVLKKKKNPGLFFLIPISKVYRELSLSLR